jgi:hypothetical protein
VERVEELPATVEGHEQFAVRGLPAGVFVVQEHAASTPATSTCASRSAA